MRIKMGMMAIAFTAMGYGCDDGGDAGGGDPVGASCTVGQASCASGFCFPDQTQPYCTEECTPGSCPSGFECSPNAQPNVCVRVSGGEGGAGGGGEGGAGGGGEGGAGGGGEGGMGGGEGGMGGGEGGMGGGEGGMGGGGEGGMGGGSPMDLDCAGINECLSVCGQGDQACFNACVESGTPQAQEEFIAIIDCIQANGGDQEPCQAEIEQCLGAQPMGDGECPDFYSCAGDCPDDDQDCVQGCFNGLAPAAQNLVLDVVNCVGPVVDANPDANDEELNDLINEQCAAEIEACFGEPAPPGDDTCGEVLSCIEGVMTQDEAQACFDAGTEAAREEFIALQQCAIDAECMDFACPACQAEFDICNGGGAPEPEAPEPAPMPEGEPEGEPEPMPEPMPEAPPEAEPQPAPEPEN